MSLLLLIARHVPQLSHAVFVVVDARSQPQEGIIAPLVAILSRRDTQQIEKQQNDHDANKVHFCVW